MTHRGAFQPLPFCDSVILRFGVLIQKWTVQGGRKYADVVAGSSGKLLLSFTYVGGRKQKVRST